MTKVPTDSRVQAERLDGLEAQVGELHEQLTGLLAGLAAEDELYSEIESAMNRVSVYSAAATAMEAMHDKAPNKVGRKSVDLGGMAWALITSIECDRGVESIREDSDKYEAALELVGSVLGVEWRDEYAALVSTCCVQYEQIGRLRRTMADSFASQWLRATKELWPA